MVYLTGPFAPEVTPFQIADAIAAAGFLDAENSIEVSQITDVEDMAIVLTKEERQILNKRYGLPEEKS